MSGSWRLLLPAVGGQGGGVLMQWLLAAARGSGLRAQGIAQPGLSQRAGMTAYYVELAMGTASPMGLFPVPGDVDVILAPELLELGRALEQGYATPERTLVVASTQRSLSTPEKLPGGPGVYPAGVIERAARSLAWRCVLLDAPALLRAQGLPERAAGALLAGALCATGALPVPATAWREAIEGGENQVAFALGLAAGGGGSGAAVGSGGSGAAGGGGAVAAVAGDPGATVGGPVVAVAGDPGSAGGALAARVAGWATALGRQGAAYRRLWQRIATAFPAPLHALLAEAAYRLTQYHDAAYAAEYLERVGPFAALESGADTAGYPLTATVARHVARWMMYEDAPRVAELKTDRRRWQELHQRHKAGAGAVLRVVDYLAPEPWDLYTLLPHGLLRCCGVAPVEQAVPDGRHLHLRLRSSGLWGYALLRALTWLRPLRRRSYRMAWERVRLNHYCQRVLAIAAADGELGLIAAAGGDLVRGYGPIRRRGLHRLAHLLDAVALPAPEGATAAERLAVRQRTQAYLQGEG